MPCNVGSACCNERVAFQIWSSSTTTWHFKMFALFKAPLSSCCSSHNAFVVVQNLFTMGYAQWVQDKPTDLSSVEYLNGQRPVPSCGLFILQGLLDIESDGNFAVDLREGGFGLWATMLRNLAQTALDDSLENPRAAQMIDDATKTYVCLLRTCHLQLFCMRSQCTFSSKSCQNAIAAVK